jgi:hypothetical protein
MAAQSLPHVELILVGDSIPDSRFHWSQAGRLGKLALRQQLAVFTRNKKRPRLHNRSYASEATNRCRRVSSTSRRSGQRRNYRVLATESTSRSATLAPFGMFFETLLEYAYGV